MRTSAITGSIGPPSGPVAWRIVVADPDLASAPSRHRAADFFRVTPDDLRVVPAHAATPVRTIVVVPSFRRPGVDNLGGGRGRTGNLEQVLAVGRVWTVDELLARQKSVRPVLRTCGQPIGPRQGRYSHARPHNVVDSQHIGRERGWCGSGRPLAKAPPLCAAGSGQDDQNPDRLPHASIDAHEWTFVDSGQASPAPKCSFCISFREHSAGLRWQHRPGALGPSRAVHLERS